MLIEDATRFNERGWFAAARQTPALTLHALYRDTDPVPCFGIKGAAIDPQFATAFMTAIEALPSDALRADHGYVQRKLAPFDGIGHVAGPQRRFLNGWAGTSDRRIVHLFPAYDCEFLGLQGEKPFVEVMRTLDVLDIQRQADPHFEIQMQGGKSKLQIKKWSKVPYAQLVTYAKILETESGASLSVRNIRGDVVEFGDKSGWQSAAERIKRHVFLSA